ncbi:MAG TPA: methyltransferase domain-containing protein [Ktedonobacterales bacterium]|nr:methyltransferase domain-containing protein [Ktedonobacterales bacterium]
MARDMWAEPEAWDEETARGSAAILDARAAAPDQVRLRAALIALAGVGAGETVVEVGSGTGPLLVDLARTVGPTGRAIGIEPQAHLAALAREKLACEGLAEIAEVRAGRAEALELTDAFADVCIAQTVLLHVPATVLPRALAEMARAVKPGGRVLTLDQDMSTFVVDHPDTELTERIVRANLQRYEQPWMGRQARRRLMEAGLRDVRVEVIVQAETDPAGHLIGSAERTAQAVADIGAITADEAEGWLQQLREQVDAGHFFASLNYYACVGTKSE